jgi:hypothetical protein
MFPEYFPLLLRSSEMRLWILLKHQLLISSVWHRPIFSYTYEKIEAARYSVNTDRFVSITQADF